MARHLWCLQGMLDEICYMYTYFQRFFFFFNFEASNFEPFQEHKHQNPWNKMDMNMMGRGNSLQDVWHQALLPWSARSSQGRKRCTANEGKKTIRGTQLIKNIHVCHAAHSSKRTFRRIISSFEWEKCWFFFFFFWEREVKMHAHSLKGWSMHLSTMQSEVSQCVVRIMQNGIQKKSSTSLLHWVES